MSVKLLRSVLNYPAGAVVTFPDDTERAIIAQGLGTASLPTTILSNVGAPDAFGFQAGNPIDALQGGQSGVSSTNAQLQYGPKVWCNAPLGNAALTATGASSVHVAGTIYLSEIYVPYWNLWTGVADLNGTVVGTDNLIGAIYGNDGTLLANSVLTGTLSASASTFQNLAFVTPVYLPPGRYFLALQCNGTTATSNKFVSANGNNVMTSATAGVFGTLPATLTVPSSFTTAQGVVMQLYT